MRERGDLECLHEPFMHFYYVERRVREMPHFGVDPAQPTKYEAIREHLLEKAGRHDVFLKDMSYYVIPQIFEDASFAERLTNCFLIRDPMKSIMSYTLEEVGVEAQWRHFEWLSSLAAQRPVVIDAELVQQDSVSMIAKLWEQIDLPFRAQAFSWNQQETPEDWDRVAGWHAEVTSSSGIRPHKAAQEIKARQRFDDTATQAPQLYDYLAHHRPFYNKLRAQALTA